MRRIEGAETAGHVMRPATVLASPALERPEVLRSGAERTGRADEVVDVSPAGGMPASDDCDDGDACTTEGTDV